MTQCVYQRAQRCTGGPTPGAKALMSWYLGAYQDQGAVNSGIYNCRPIGSGSTLSLHGEGRAADLGVRPLSAPYGWHVADALVDHAEELGVQLVIWDRMIWSAARCNQGWRPYNGSNPHTDHLHVELLWWAADTLTPDMVDLHIHGEAAAPVEEDSMAVMIATRRTDHTTWIIAGGFRLRCDDLTLRDRLLDTGAAVDIGELSPTALNHWPWNRPGTTTWPEPLTLAAHDDFDQEQSLLEED